MNRMMSSSSKLPWRERLNFSRWAIAHPRWTIAFWFGVAVAGLLAWSSLKYALFPDVTFPVVVVNATAPISTTLETEAQLTQPIERAVAGIEGLYDLRSTTLAGRTVVSSAFLVGTRLTDATNSVESMLVDLNLPQGTSYDVNPINLNESTAISYAVTSESLSLDELAQITETEILPSLHQLPGVLKVNLLGTGSFAEGSSSQSSNPATLVRFNGQNALALQVIKQADANTLEVVDQAEAAINQLQQQFPELELTVAASQADYIRESTQSTLEALGLGLVLAVLVMFPFLRNWRATLISAVAIPLSLLGTCIVMAWAGFNLETITLLALTLVIGIVVDDAIVEVENIARHLESGMSSKEAAIQATNEIGLTVTASTLTIVAVFLPVAFMGDALGQFFKPFALTISAAVLISLLVARTLSPVLAMLWLRVQPGNSVKSDRNNGGALRSADAPYNSHGLGSADGALRSANAPYNFYGSGVYQRMLRWSLEHRGWVIGIAIGSFIVGLGLIPLVPQGFLPKLDRGEFNVIYTTTLPNLPSSFPTNPPADSSENPASRRLVLSPQNSISSDILGTRFHASTQPTIVNRYSHVGRNLDNPRQLSAKSDPYRHSRAAGNPGNRLRFVQNNPEDPNPDPSEPILKPGGFGWIRELTRNPIQLLLRRTRNTGEEIEAVILNRPDVESAFTTVGLREQPNKGKIYVKLKDDRELTTAEAQAQIRAALPSLPDVTISVEDLQFVETGDEKPLQIVLVGDDVEAITQTAQTIKTEAEKFPGFVDVTATDAENSTTEVNQIQHFQQQRAAYVTANLSESQGLGDATEQLVKIAEPLLPPGIELKLTGDSARIGQVLRSFAVTLAISITLMLTLLLLPFGRLLEPLVVGLSLPLSIVGAMLALLVTQSAFGIISVIGLIFLLGLLDKNALLIMDYINQLRRQGLNRTEAILAMGRVRLRPIIMTTTSTILGMFPVSLGWGASAELRQPMAVAIIGGLLTSTLLSLIVVPVLYTVLEDISWMPKSGRKKHQTLE
ncbi:MAG: efflux RND transporter permease subunit [Microcoleaceae cyanobacterium]